MSDVEQSGVEEFISENAEVQGDDAEHHGFIRSALALVELFVRPNNALSVLFSSEWPKFLFTLLVLYVAVPLAFHSVGDPSKGLDAWFVFINRYFVMSPPDFQRLCFLLSGLSLMALVFLFSILLRVILLPQSDEMSLLDCVGTICYALFPLFVVLVVQYTIGIATTPQQLFDLGIPRDNILTTTLESLSLGGIFAVLSYFKYGAILWGLYLCFATIMGLTDIPAARVLSTIVIVVSMPLFCLLLSVTIILAFPTTEFGKEFGKEDKGPSYDHILDSMKKR